ncbi:hydrolase [Rossellomorea marisflavi]|uniref:hypothetical protein n=1 Tax=Rossellomorea TaxID=2837508 RepID=UPI00064E375A|nr:hypothetical protein [Rossellomorea marisflavi]MBV6686287.1 hydrolase [Bacillus sp. JRC01]KMK91261.1 hypothetical protein VL03_20350 [Rossellomorea marisflavi]KML27672.1 hypothetical protein VL12_21080 [Rossellomorea marisflavi]QHA34414.1 hydrolase [Rossellomorea marisflavi]TYO70358.1 hydrolase [Rossellomorea marisflavi]
MEEKMTYYVDINSGDVTPEAEQNHSPSFRIFATPEQVEELKLMFEQNDADAMSTMRRAQVPFRQYHNSPEDDRYDESMRQIYGKIFELGDEEAKRHIVENGILESKHNPNLREDIENLK